MTGDWWNRVGLTGALVGEYETDLAAYEAARRQADAGGVSVVTYRVDRDGRPVRGQEGVWTDPTAEESES